jgi:hypothetical protein
MRPTRSLAAFPNAARTSLWRESRRLNKATMAPVSTSAMFRTRGFLKILLIICGQIGRPLDASDQAEPLCNPDVIAFLRPFRDRLFDCGNGNHSVPIEQDRKGWHCSTQARLSRPSLDATRVDSINAIM